MRNLLNPKWLLVVNTVPIMVLFLLFYSQYTIVKSLLTDESLTLWRTFGGVLFGLCLIHFAYALWLILKRQSISLYYGFVALVLYIVFLYMYGNYAWDIIPFDIPRWMIPGDLFMYVGTFVMPTLAHALFVLVGRFTAEQDNPKAGLNFLIAVTIPILWYLFSQIILPFWKPVDSNFGVHFIIVMVIVGTVAFLFFLIRGIYILAFKKSALWIKYQLVWKIPISLVFPWLGLAINNGHLLDTYGYYGNGLFGNFHSPWFYGLAMANALFICLPNTSNAYYRLLLLACRAVTFSFTTYFFLVFLPFLPLSVIAIAAVGVGFLMLSPLVLMVVHVNQLSGDLRDLRNHFSRLSLISILLTGIAVLPIGVTLSFLKDKSTLNESLEYLYTPNYTKDYQIDIISLRKTLEVIKAHKVRGREVIIGAQTPYISSYFNWLVLDNLTLSDAKINQIEQVFMGEPMLDFGSEALRNEHVCITDFSTKSTFDDNQQAWVSWVDLEITNEASNTWFAEYATTFDLPVGCWISDYYLYVGDRKEPGILAEKKSAMWVFSQIRNENRDPGLLYYLTGNRVAFRVFPFTEMETRHTGIEFVHKEPVTLKIDGFKIKLGHPDSVNQIETSHQLGNLAYISSIDKKTLPLVQRQPYYHFIVDVSAGKGVLVNKYQQRILGLINNQPLTKGKTKISFTNSHTTTVDFNSQWQEAWQSQTFAGGFYLQRAFEKALVRSYESLSDDYPVFVVVTDSLDQAILPKNFANLSMTYPESDLFYVLDQDGQLIPHALNHHPKEPLDLPGPIKVTHPVLAWPGKNSPRAYLRNDTLPAIAIGPQVEGLGNGHMTKGWQAGLRLQGMWFHQLLHPELSQKLWLETVKNSFKSKIMTPQTSYIVVENEAQKAMLLKKQAQILAGNKSLDVGEETPRMSEPKLLLLVLLLGIFFYLRRFVIQRKLLKSA